jgi:hypothetical protein
MLTREKAEGGDLGAARFLGGGRVKRGKNRITPWSPRERQNIRRKTALDLLAGFISISIVDQEKY